MIKCSPTISKAFCLIFVIVDVLNLAHCDSTGATTHVAARSHNNNGWNRRSITSTQQNCEFKDQLTQLHDRISVLATSDEDLRSQLKNIEKKIDQHEKHALERMDIMSERQMDILKRLDSIEVEERSMQRNLEESKELLLRAPRQTDTEHLPINSNEEQVGESQKFDALSVLITSTRYAIKELQQELQANISKLVQVTNNFQRRLNNIQRRHNNVQTHSNLYATPTPPAEELITNCAQGANTIDGILKLQLTSVSVPFYVRCDEKYMGGGWTVVQDRYAGNINFQRGWLEYKSGFGNLADEFFIGLEKLHAMTASNVHELIIVVEDHEGEQRYAKYSQFAIAGEDHSYALHLLGQYSGNAGDSFSYHAGSKFSTFDSDNDGCPDCNCAQAHFGGWWYNWCDMSNLNGKYFTKNFNNTPSYQGVYWHSFHGANYSLRAVRMMIRPVNADQENQR